MKKIFTTILVSLLLLVNICTVATVSASTDHHEPTPSECAHCDTYDQNSDHGNTAAHFPAKIKQKVPKTDNGTSATFFSAPAHSQFTNFQYQDHSLQKNTSTSQRMGITVKRE